MTTNPSAMNSKLITSGGPFGGNVSPWRHSSRTCRPYNGLVKYHEFDTIWYASKTDMKSEIMLRRVVAWVIGCVWESVMDDILVQLPYDIIPVHPQIIVSDLTSAVN